MSQASGAESTRGVLIVEDQYLLSEFLRVWVETFGLEVCGTATTTARAIELAVLHRPGFVLMDVYLGGGQDDGVEAATAIRERIDTRLIYCTGSSDAATLARLASSKPHAILIKPIDPTELGRLLRAD